MRKSRFTETQIVKILKEVEGGRQVKEGWLNFGNETPTVRLCKREPTRH